MKIKIKPHGDEVRFLDSNYTCLAVISLNFALKKDNNCYPQVLLKECKHIEKKVARHIHDNLSDFSYSSDESDEGQIKSIRLMIFENLFFEGAILKESNEK